MRILISALLTMLLVLTCGSNKKELNLENETDESLHEKAVTAYETGEYAKAFQYDSLLLIYFPISDLHIEAQLNMAKALGGQERYEDQLDLLLRLLKENIVPEVVPKIYIQIGQFYEHAAIWNPKNITTDTTDWEKAAGYYRKAVFYPNSQDKMVKAKALYRAGLMYAKIKNYQFATNAYNEVVNSFSESPYSTLAKIKLQDPTNTSEIGFESEAAQELEEERKTILQAKEEPKPVVEEPDQIGVVAPEDTTVQLEIDNETKQTIDQAIPEMEDEDNPVIPDTSAMEEF